jgi:Fic family protein
MNNTRAGSLRKMPEGYSAFMPSTLPLDEINLGSISRLLSEADRAIGSLRNVEHFVPNVNLLTKRYAEKEALLSSQIEGTQSSLVELLSSAHKTHKSVDVIEVENYFKALNHGITRLTKDDFPFCLRLVKEMHEILMTGVRGGEAGNTPGEFRTSQNWIGGSKPSNAIFVPPPPHEVINLMGNLEKYLHEDDVPPLIKCALIHYQFETIHPFCDGNGRIGRILITLYLIWKEVISTPILYLSLYFKKNRQSYYEYLSIPRQTGNFEKWIEFFLQGVVYTTQQINKTTDSIILLEKEDRKRLIDVKSKHTDALLLAIQTSPIITLTEAAEMLNVTHETARNLIKSFVDIGILEQISEGNRNKRYIYKGYMDILEEGCENF